MASIVSLRLANCHPCVRPRLARLGQHTVTPQCWCAIVDGSMCSRYDGNRNGNNRLDTTKHPLLAARRKGEMEPVRLVTRLDPTDKFRRGNRLNRHACPRGTPHSL